MIQDHSIKQLSKLISEKKISPTELAQETLDKINTENKKLNCFIRINESLVEEAKEIEKNLKKYSDKKLVGIPIGIKDLICTEGIETTAGSKILTKFTPPYTATLVHRLKDHGALVSGKCNLDEFAMGSSNENSYFGVTKNPWDLERVPGGSSGGSAAAMAARLSCATIGTDTGGSIRQPASHCGIVGVKPTYGRISRYGVIAFASSLDQAGPMTLRVEDSALLLEVMCGADKYDATSSHKESFNWSENLTGQIRGRKIGIVEEIEQFDLDPEIESIYRERVQSLEKAGAQIVPLSFKMLKYAIPVYYLIATSEASSNLARYDGVRYGYRSDFETHPAEDLEDFYCRTRSEGFGEEVKRRVLIGTFSLSSGFYDEYFNKAAKVRRLIKDEFKENFKSCDVVISPVSICPAFKIGEKLSDPLTMYQNDVYTTLSNLAGIPAMSVPMGHTSKRLPIGLHIMAPWFKEDSMLDVAKFIEDEFAAWKGLPVGLR